MDPIKQAFTKAKQDILNLQSEIFTLKTNIDEIKSILTNLVNILEAQNTQKANSIDAQTETPTDVAQNQSIQQINPTDQAVPTHIPTDKQPLYSVKEHYSISSIGNQGVPTDRQTNQQTDRHILKTPQKFALRPEISFQGDKISHIEKVSEILSSLDTIKKDLRSKFKRLTSQEMLVFSAIYQLEEQGMIVDYHLIASKLGLSESSIRDYTLKIIKKGIPLIKNKENNKKITLSIASDLKKIASLQTILQLREI